MSASGGLMVRMSSLCTEEQYSGNGGLTFKLINSKLQIALHVSAARLFDHLAAEHAIDENEVADRQRHSDSPDQQVWIHRSRRSHQHEDQVCRRCKKRAGIILFSAEAEHGEQRGSHGQRNNVKNRKAFVVVQ